MTEPVARPLPPDQRERAHALDPSRSVLVQAPAGSGKTDLLTRRFLRLLGEVDSPTEIAAITFTRAAAAEMRHRILTELERAQDHSSQHPVDSDELSMQSLAHRALLRSRALGWNLIETPSQLRISTIDSFCRELALQQPLLSGLGSEIEITDQAAELYRRAAQRTLEQIDADRAPLAAAVESLLAWRDNNWQDLEDLLVKMLGQRDRWMHDFVLDREPDWDTLRADLERPFATAVRDHLTLISTLLQQTPGARDEILALARFACEEPGKRSPRDLAELVEIESHPFSANLESALDTYRCLASFLQTQQGKWKSERGLQLHDGFPATARGRSGKARFARLIATLDAAPALESALASVPALPPLHYADDEWRIVRACFTLLRHAAGELLVVFAESGVADFVAVAQTALAVLRAEDGSPSEAALAISEGIRHLLVDEFQDTSRRQHRLLAAIVAAWPEREGRTLFAVGDPMQSIYFFRDADAELFPRVSDFGLELNASEALPLDFVRLRSNFRTAPPLVAWANDSFAQIFSVDDGSGIAFAEAEAARRDASLPGPPFALHLHFTPRRSSASKALDADAEIENARQSQLSEIVDLIRGYLPAIESQRLQGGKFRVAVLGRAKKSLAAVAAALREAGIPFRAVELESLADRPEVRDAIALARALFNPEDRVAWLGVLRAPWCGLGLNDLHKLVSDDDAALLARPIPDLLRERSALLGESARSAVDRVLQAIESAAPLRSALPNARLGTWLEQVWLRVGGAECVDASARANLDLLWRCLDNLPSGEIDLLSPALDAALAHLAALPDPAASSDCGVQLMTIHKSKGLEFEVVLVPDLQAKGGSREREMLSWLERGIAPSAGAADSGELTEFLIAPLQARGDDRGLAKAWVDRTRRARERQEDRRILYVAATRAREQLHFFSLPSYTTNSAGAFELCDPEISLLKTAWPAVGQEIQTRFNVWSDVHQPALIPAIAAAAIIEAPAPSHLHRLPPGYHAPLAPVIASVRKESVASDASQPVFERREGGIESRALGLAVHTCLEHLALRADVRVPDAVCAALDRLAPRVVAGIRSLGLDSTRAAQIAQLAIDSVCQAATDPLLQWILAPHLDAASEIRWVGVVRGELRTVQADRVFRAGAAPLAEGDDAWWIIDYKTHAAESAEELPALRSLFAPQLELYADVLRELRHGSEIRAGIYYPRIRLFDWWKV